MKKKYDKEHREQQWADDVLARQYGLPRTKDKYRRAA